MVCMKPTPATSHLSRRSQLLATAVLAGLFAGAGGFVDQQEPPQPQAPGAAPATAPATAPAEAVIVTSVEGKARARANPDAEWKLVEVGMRLPQGAQIQTGQASRVVCAVPPGREFVVDRLSTVTVLEAEQRGNRLRTDLLMEYGRTDLRVQKAGLEQDARIRTPGATASVRGTALSVYNQPPFAPELRTYTGVVDYRFARRQLTVAKGGRSTGGRGTAETALLASVVDPNTRNARTNADAAFISQEVSRGAVVTYNQDIRLTEIRGGAGAQTDAQLFRSLPGKLNFVIRWDGNVDVDVFVAVDARPLEEIFAPTGATFNPTTILFPGYGLETAPSGGRIPYNHRGGARGGQEICFWPDAFPQGVYGFSALNNSETATADVRFNAFLDGNKVPMYTFDVDGNLVRGNGFRRTLGPVNNDPNDLSDTASMVVPVPRSDLFELIIPEVPDETLDGTAAAPPPPAPVQSAVQPAPPRGQRSGQKGVSKPAKPNRAAVRETRPSARLSKPQPLLRNR
jgi:hypothetical protein